VKRTDNHITGGVTAPSRDPLAELLRGPVCEGDTQNTVGGNPAPERFGGAFSQGKRLPSADGRVKQGSPLLVLDKASLNVI